MNIGYILIASSFHILSFPTVNFWWLSFIALVPFLSVIEKTKTFFKQVGNGAVWSLAISSGLGYWLFPTLCTNYEVALPKAILFFSLCVWLPIFVLIIGFIFSYQFTHRNHILFYALILPSLWTLMEYLKEVAPILLPWGEIGSALIPFTYFVQMADITGVHGITFIVIMINGLVYYILRPAAKKATLSGIAQVNKPPESRRQTIIALMLVVALFIIPIAYGKIRIASLDSQLNSKLAKGLAINVQLIQGNFNSLERWSGMGFYHRLQRYLEMTESGEHTGEKKRVIVWPETVLNSTTRVDDNLFLQIMESIGQDALLISGGLKEDPATGRVLNSAYLISGQGSVMRYDKHILLPYAENSPLINLLDRYYNAPNQFQAGSSPLCFQTENGAVGISICFETLYPSLIRTSVKRGAGFLVNISNDDWFGKSSMPYVQLNGARLRAIENRRYLLRASNSGISAIISPAGEILHQSRLFVCEQVSGEFFSLDSMTFYTRFGDIILYLSVLFVLTALVRIILRS